MNYFFNRLEEICNKLFFNSISTFILVKECPMLIGIMRRSAGEKGWSCISEYDFQILMKNDMITRTQEKVTSEQLQHELKLFKEKFDENEEALVS